LNSFLVAPLDQFAQQRTYTRCEANSLTWLFDNGLCAIQERNRKYSRYRVSKTPEGWECFRSLRNRASHISYRGDSFSFLCVDEMCFAASIGKITSNATGLDGIPLVFIKLLLPLILLVRTQLFNFILTSSTFPLVWKISNVVPISKVNNPTERSDYRTISIVPVLAKTF
jgi:hypothetical protein